MRLTSPAALIDIGRITELKGITSKDGVIRIGALTTHAERRLVGRPEGVVPDAGRGRGADRRSAGAQLRHHRRQRRTRGSGLRSADRVRGLDARFTVAGPKGTRTIAAADFFQGMMTTALAEREILTAIEFAAVQAGEGMAYDKFTHPASRYAVVGAAAVVTVKGGACTGARVAIGGLLPAATRLSVRRGRTERREAVGGSHRQGGAIGWQRSELESGDVLEDVFASAEYRRAMAAVFVKRALTAAFDRAA